MKSAELQVYATHTKRFPVRGSGFHSFDDTSQAPKIMLDGIPSSNYQVQVSAKSRGPLPLGSIFHHSRPKLGSANGTLHKLMGVQMSCLPANPHPESKYQLPSRRVQRLLAFWVPKFEQNQ